MVVAVVVGTRLHRPAQPLAWYLLAGGLLSFTVGEDINYTYQWVVEDELAAGITGLRRLMAELRPAVLDEQGLEVALHSQVRAFEATCGVACAISTGLESRLAPDLETVLYRVTQESLNNAASRLLSEGHFGLAGMRERVEMVGGHLGVDSAPGGGTTVDVGMANHSP